MLTSDWLIKTMLTVIGWCRYGLIREGSDNSEEDGDSLKDNPVIAALEKVRLRQQTSDDTGSRPASKMSHTRYRD